MADWTNVKDSGGTFVEGIRQLGDFNIRQGVANVGLGYTRLIFMAIVGGAAVGAVYMLPQVGPAIKNRFVTPIDGLFQRVAAFVSGA